MRIRFRRFRFASAISIVGLFISPLVHAQPELANAFETLHADASWKLVRETSLGFDTHHPQGMTRVGDRVFLSSVEVVDRAAGKGVGHLFEIGESGELHRSLTLSDGPVYHPGGIDFDGTSIWLCLAEYRPDSRSIVYRIDPESLVATEVFRFADHLGAVVHLPDARLLVGVSWGSRRIYAWDMQENGMGPLDASRPRVIKNPSLYVAYQDMQRIEGTNIVLASGVRTLRGAGRETPAITLGGIDLLAFPGAVMRHGQPVNLKTPKGVPMTQNPFYARLDGDEIRFWFIPEDDESILYECVAVTR